MRGGDGAHGAAVEAVVEGEELCADVLAFGAQQAGVGAGELERSLPGFGAAVAEEDAVEAADLGEAEGEFGGVLVEEEVRGVEEALRSVRDGFFDGGMGVAEGGDADAAEQIEVVVAVLVAQIDAVAADEEDGVAFVGVEEQLLLRCLDGLQLCSCDHDLRSVVDPGGARGRVVALPPLREECVRV